MVYQRIVIVFFVLAFSETFIYGLNSKFNTNINCERRKSSCYSMIINDKADYQTRFGSLSKLYGEGSLERLSSAHVCVVGVGGVGSWCIEALARSGIGQITIVDSDDICVSNVNRQLHATSSSIGRFKIDVMKERLMDINPHVNVTAACDFLTSRNVHSFIAANADAFDIVIDAVDDVQDKVALIHACVHCNVSVITCGGGGGLTDPTLIRTTDLARATGDNLLKWVRKELRQKHGYPQGSPSMKRPPAQWQIEAVHTLPTGHARSDPDPESESGTCAPSSLRKCDSMYGNAVFCTGTIGFVAAGVAVSRIATGTVLHPKPLHRPRTGIETADHLGSVSGELGHMRVR